MGRRRIRPADEEFASVWNSSQNPTEAAEKMTLSKSTVMDYATELRHKGFPMKSFRGCHKKATKAHQYAEMVRSGKSANTVAREQGVTRQAVYSSLKNAGYRPDGSLKDVR